MISRIGITVSLLRASDGSEYPEFQVTEFAKKDRLNSTAIQVTEGDTFFVRVFISSKFAWHDANVLELVVNYDDARPWDRSYNFIFPRIQKPEFPQMIIVDLIKCPVNIYGLARLKGCSTRFNISKVLHRCNPLCRANANC